MGLRVSEWLCVCGEEGMFQFVYYVLMEVCV